MTIDLSTYKARRPVRSRKQEEEAGSPAPLPSVTVEDKIIELKEQHPGKHVFTVSEAADILNAHYEFVRRRVKDGTIASTPHGARHRRIALETLAELLVSGIPN